MAQIDRLAESKAAGRQVKRSCVINQIIISTIDFTALGGSGDASRNTGIISCRASWLTAKTHRDLLPARALEADLDRMRLCLKLKVEQHPVLKANLKATGQKLIVQDWTVRPKGDALYWGPAQITGQWVGENWLGRLWMEMRGKGG